MAITGQVVATKTNCISFLLTHDGAGGDAITLTAAQLGAAAPPGQFRDFLLHEWVGNNQANARLRLGGEGVPAALGGLGPNLTEVNHCRCFVRQRAGLILAVAVDFDVDGVDALQNEINIATPAGVAGTFQLDVEFQYTAIR
jgi:hypothetical protein